VLGVNLSWQPSFMIKDCRPVAIAVLGFDSGSQTIPRLAAASSLESDRSMYRGLARTSLDDDHLVEGLQSLFNKGQLKQACISTTCYNWDLNARSSNLASGSQIGTSPTP
jgi:hypothetical protein